MPTNPYPPPYWYGNSGSSHYYTSGTSVDATFYPVTYPATTWISPQVGMAEPREESPAEWLDRQVREITELAA